MTEATKTAYSRVSVKSQTVLPREVRDRLGIKAGDRLRFRITDRAVILERASPEVQDDPFASFAEWASADDDEAFANL